MPERSELVMPIYDDDDFDGVLWPILLAVLAIIVALVVLYLSATAQGGVVTFANEAKPEKHDYEETIFIPVFEERADATLTVSMWSIQDWTLNGPMHLQSTATYNMELTFPTFSLFLTDTLTHDFRPREAESFQYGPEVVYLSAAIPADEVAQLSGAPVHIRQFSTTNHVWDGQGGGYSLFSNISMRGEIAFVPEPSLMFAVVACAVARRAKR